MNAEDYAVAVSDEAYEAAEKAWDAIDEAMEYLTQARREIPADMEHRMIGITLDAVYRALGGAAWELGGMLEADGDEREGRLLQIRPHRRPQQR